MQVTIIDVIVIINKDEPINIAQFLKNSCGKIRIIWSVLGLNNQLSFPGKKIVWKTSNALSKSIDAKIPTTTGIKIAIIDEKNIGWNLLYFLISIILNLCKHKIIVERIRDETRHQKLRSNKILQSSKCDLPLSEYFKTPVLNSVLKTK